MERNNGNDLFRLIGAFFIMALHTSLGSMPLAVADNILLLSRWAVPFFFISTGFFIGKKIDTTGKIQLSTIQGNISRLMTVFLIANAIYLLIHLLMGDFSFGIETIFAGTNTHLWFIGSLLFGYFFIWYCLFNNQLITLIIISISIIIIALYANSYSYFFKTSIADFSVYRFLLSIPFMGAGIYISKHNHLSTYKAILLLLMVLGIGLQIIEANVFANLFNISKQQHQLLLGTLLIAPSIFILSSSLRIPINVFSQWGKEHSLFIYLYHPITYLLMAKVFGKLFANQYNEIEMFFPLIGFALTLLTAIVMQKTLKPVYALLNGDLLLSKQRGI
jgi:hypothetical protein